MVEGTCRGLCAAFETRLVLGYFALLAIRICAEFAAVRTLLKSPEVAQVSPNNEFFAAWKSNPEPQLPFRHE